MVLESLLNAEDAQEHPWKIVVLSFAFATIAVWLAGSSGLGGGGIVIVGLSSIASIPFLLRLFDAATSKLNGEQMLGSTLLGRHAPVVVVMASLFFGLLAGYVFWQLYLPESQVRTLFDAQTKELIAINPAVGRAASPLSGVEAVKAFEIIFFHNLQVVGIILFLCVLYGAGAVAVLSWNASVIATFLSVLAKKIAGTDDAGSTILLGGLTTGFLGILPHGSLELLSYLMVTLSGGIISSAVIHRLPAGPFTLVLYDAARLLCISILFLAAGAAIESSVLG